MNDIVIRGKVTIRQGDRVLVKDALNHFVDAGLKGLVSNLTCKDGDGSFSYWYLWQSSTGKNMYLGSNTTTATTTGMTALTTPIGTTPGTAQDVITTESVDGTSTGIWRAIYHATWNAGAVSGTLGELALYLRAPTKTAYGWRITTDYTPASAMVSRLSAADTDFSSFTINTAVPLTVDWTVEFAFT